MPGVQAIEIYQRETPLHGHAQTDILTVHRIHAATLVSNQTVRPGLIVIGARFSFYNWGRCYAKRYFRRDPRLEYPLRAQKRNAPAVKEACAGDPTLMDLAQQDQVYNPVRTPE